MTPPEPAPSRGVGFPIAVTGHHVLSPVGFGAEATCAALRAGISRITRHPDYYPQLDPEDSEPPELLAAAFIPDLDPRFKNRERLELLAADALSSLIESAGLTRADMASSGLWVALPDADAATERWSLQEGFVSAVLERCKMPSFEKSATAQAGSAGMLALLREASAWLQKKEVARCILLGVDSFVSTQRLELLDAERRLKSPLGVDGFVPGEAASALLLERAGSAEGRAELARLSEVCCAQEPSPIRSERESTAAGLCEAIRGTLKVLPEGHGIRWAFSDQNGESYRSREWGLACARLAKEMGAVDALGHSAACIGEVGAASAGVLIAWAAQAFQRGYAEDDVALVVCGSDDGMRAAALVQRPA